MKFFSVAAGLGLNFGSEAVLFDLGFNQIFIARFGYGKKIKLNAALAEAYKFERAGRNRERRSCELIAVEEGDFSPQSKNSALSSVTDL